MVALAYRVSLYAGGQVKGIKGIQFFLSGQRRKNKNGNHTWITVDSRKKGGVIGAFSLFPNGESLTHKTQPTLRLTAHFKDPDF
jgi:hypothetical protein